MPGRRELTQSEKRFVWIPKLINKALDLIPELLVLISGFFIGIAGVPVAMKWVVAQPFVLNLFPEFTEGVAQVCAYVAGTLILIVNVIATAYRKKTRSALELELQSLRNGREKDLLDLKRVLQQAVIELSQECDVWNDHTRASLYRHSAATSSFIRLARVSLNPHLQTGGRQDYPDTEGIIANAWTSGGANVRDLKDRASAKSLVTSTTNHLLGSSPAEDQP